MKLYLLNESLSVKAKALLDLKGISTTTSTKDTDILYVHFEHFNIDNFPSLKYIVCPCTNINHLKKSVFHKPDILYLDSPRWLYDNVHSTAETSLWGILKLLKIGLEGSLLHKSYEVRGKTVGIIGAGRVGQQLALKLSGLGANILLYDVQYTIFDNVWPESNRCRDMDELLYRSHIISVHAAANELTENLIGDKEFKNMVLRPWFINTSRGSVVDGKALIQAARSNQIRGFYIDVMDSYDVETKNELLTLARSDNYIVTKHKAGSCVESRELTDLYLINRLLKKLKVE